MISKRTIRACMSLVTLLLVIPVSLRVLLRLIIFCIAVLLRTVYLREELHKLGKQSGAITATTISQIPGQDTWPGSEHHIEHSNTEDAEVVEELCKVETAHHNQQPTRRVQGEMDERIRAFKVSELDYETQKNLVKILKQEDIDLQKRRRWTNASEHLLRSQSGGLIAPKHP